MDMINEQPMKETVADPHSALPTVLARQVTDSGEIQLQHRCLADGSGIFEIISDGVFLMSSQSHSGEQVLAQQALLEIAERLPADRQVLIGGLGMGFTLRETLQHAVTRVDVVEISDHVIAWNRQFFGPLNDGALDDARVHLIHDDLYSVLSRAKVGTYAAIMVDVDNGPSWLVHGRNARLYTDEMLAIWSTRLAPRGVLAVWSAQQEPEFMERMRLRFRAVEETAVPVPDPQGRPWYDYIYRGTR